MFLQALGHCRTVRNWFFLENRLTRRSCCDTANFFNGCSRVFFIDSKKDSGYSSFHIRVSPHYKKSMMMAFELLQKTLFFLQAKKRIDTNRAHLGLPFSSKSEHLRERSWDTHSPPCSSPKQYEEEVEETEIEGKLRGRCKDTWACQHGTWRGQDKDACCTKRSMMSSFASCCADTPHIGRAPRQKRS